jgi:hypothetical protein
MPMHLQWWCGLVVITDLTRNISVLGHRFSIVLTVNISVELQPLSAIFGPEAGGE